MRGESSEEDAILESIRRGHFGAASFGGIEGAASGIAYHQTKSAIEQLRSGSQAVRIAQMRGADSETATLYRIGESARPLQFVVVSRNGAITDVAGGWAFDSPPEFGSSALRHATAAVFSVFSGVSVSELESINASNRRGLRWSHPVMHAIDLAVSTVWPERDANIGFGSGSSPGSGAFYAFKVPENDWTALNAARQTAILDVASSALSRLYGILHPDRCVDRIIVGIQACDPEPKNGRIMISTVPGMYLAQKIVAADCWQSKALDG